jgi:autotransporter adhesin
MYDQTNFKRGNTMSDKSYGNYTEADIKSIASVAHNMTYAQKMDLISEIITITQGTFIDKEVVDWDYLADAEESIQQCRDVAEREEQEDSQCHPFWDSGDAYIDYPRVR